MKTAAALCALTVLGTSCAPTTPVQSAPATAVTFPSPPAALLRVPEASGSAVGIIVDLPETPAPVTAPAKAAVPPAVVESETAQLFHSADVESGTAPPVEPSDPAQPEAVAAFVVAVWANESPDSETWTEAASDWIAPSLTSTGRSVAPAAPKVSTRSAVVNAELIDSDFETRVLVTVETSDPQTGAFSVVAVDVWLVPTIKSWAVAALEFAR